MLKITTRSIVDELSRRQIPYEILNEDLGLVRFTVGNSTQILRSSTVQSSSHVGAMIADRKHLVSGVINDMNVRLPAELQYDGDQSAEAFLAAHTKVVVKPTDNAHGSGVTTDVVDINGLHDAVSIAREFDSQDNAIIQEQVAGDDLRVLIVGERYTASAVRKPANITGDGISTIRKCIEIENESNPDRSSNYQKRLNYIDIQAAERYLGDRIDSEIPDTGKVIRVTGPANIGAGGTSTDVTDNVPTAIRELAEAIAKRLRLPTCGVDFMVEDVTNPDSYVFIEVNVCPSFGLHLAPSVGQPRPVTERFVDYILEEAA